MAIHEPLDLEYFFVNIFSGSYLIFLIVCCIFITIMAARFRMNNLALGFTLALFFAIMSLYFAWAFWISLILIVFFTMYNITKIFR